MYVYRDGCTSMSVLNGMGTQFLERGISGEIVANSRRIRVVAWFSLSSYLGHIRYAYLRRGKMKDVLVELLNSNKISFIKRNRKVRSDRWIHPGFILISNSTRDLQGLSCPFSREREVRLWKIYVNLLSRKENIIVQKHGINFIMNQFVIDSTCVREQC